MNDSGKKSTDDERQLPPQSELLRVPNVLNASEAAMFLGAHVETVRRLARRGEIPSFKIGKDWRFRRDVILRWTEEAKSTRKSESVLIVDDDVQVCRILGREVEYFGYQVRFATNGVEGLELVSFKRPDMILLDLVMPKMNGPEFLRELRKTCPDLPVVIVTGYPDSELMHQAMQYGPLMVLSKPVEPAQLERAFKIVLGGKVGQRVNEFPGIERI